MNSRFGGRNISTLVIELLRGNKRILLVTPDHQSADALTLLIARAMKAAGLTYKSWLSRYELAIEKGGRHSAVRARVRSANASVLRQVPVRQGGAPQEI